MNKLPYSGWCRTSWGGRRVRNHLNSLAVRGALTQFKVDMSDFAMNN